LVTFLTCKCTLFQPCGGHSTTFIILCKQLPSSSACHVTALCLAGAWNLRNLQLLRTHNNSQLASARAVTSSSSRLPSVDPAPAHTAWQDQAAARPGRAIQSLEKVARLAKNDTFDVMRLFRNGKPNPDQHSLPSSKHRSEFSQPKLYQAQLPLRLYGHACCQRRLFQQRIATSRATDDTGD
jgi:hypothetical protein